MSLRGACDEAIHPCVRHCEEPATKQSCGHATEGQIATPFGLAMTNKKGLAMTNKKRAAMTNKKMARNDE